MTWHTLMKTSSSYEVIMNLTLDQNTEVFRETYACKVNDEILVIHAFFGSDFIW